MLKRTLIVLLTLVVSFNAIAKTPRPLPDMTIPTAKGQPIDLKKFKGKVVLVSLITLSCTECMQTIELMRGLQNEFGARGFQAVAVAVNVNAKTEVGPFIERYKIPFPMGYLDKLGTFKIADIQTDQKPFVPIVIFIDRTGTITYQYFGNSPVMKDEKNALHAIINGMVTQ